MLESKINLTNRLKREGRWDAASVWMDGKRRELRAGGLKRTEAREEAWRLVEIEYPPLPLTDLTPVLSVAVPTSPHFPSESYGGAFVSKVTTSGRELLSGILGTDLENWAEEYAVEFPPFALADLQSKVLKRVVWFIRNSGKWRERGESSSFSRIPADVEPL